MKRGTNESKRCFTIYNVCCGNDNDYITKSHNRGWGIVCINVNNVCLNLQKKNY